MVSSLLASDLLALDHAFGSCTRDCLSHNGLPTWLWRGVSHKSLGDKDFSTVLRNGALQGCYNAREHVRMGKPNLCQLTPSWPRLSPSTFSTAYGEIFTQV
ncbi:uncharacterized protein [Physcomitrium patens]|uniref:uncharacterized protein n=1 Tax=Physcomitrium patens TaxID=3218 RepID=UPI003CCD7165